MSARTLAILKMTYACHNNAHANMNPGSSRNNHGNTHYEQHRTMQCKQWTKSLQRTSYESGRMHNSTTNWQSSHAIIPTKPQAKFPQHTIPEMPSNVLQCVPKSGHIFIFLNNSLKNYSNPFIFDGVIKRMWSPFWGTWCTILDRNCQDLKMFWMQSL